jgi:hypothetical protein
MSGCFIEDDATARAESAGGPGDASVLMEVAYLVTRKISRIYPMQKQASALNPKASLTE